MILSSIPRDPSTAHIGETVALGLLDRTHIVHVKCKEALHSGAGNSEAESSLQGMEMKRIFNNSVAIDKHTEATGLYQTKNLTMN